MGVLFGIIVGLVLILTGAIVPVIIFGLWVLVAVLTIWLIGLIIVRAFSLVIEPFVWLFSIASIAVEPRQKRLTGKLLPNIMTPMEAAELRAPKPPILSTRPSWIERREEKIRAASRQRALKGRGPI